MTFQTPAAYEAIDMNDDFRAKVRSWLAENVPATMRTPVVEDEIPWGGRKGKFPNKDTRSWLQRAADKGWTAPTWPTRYGGGGLTADEAAVLHGEMERIGARLPLWSFGLWMLGPVLLEYGTEEQKEKFLPPIARGEVRWSQGYSEPGAGSDLASLKMRAEDQGDHWLVNGQKVWTSYADSADWIFCLVRTDPSTDSHRGISFLLIDMDSPGVTVRPIRLISGSSPFCETFFDDVVVPKDQLVGPLNGGWTIAKKLLEYERQNVSAIGFGGDKTRNLADVAKEHFGSDESDRVSDPVFRERVARVLMNERAVELLTKRSQQEADQGKVGFTTSVVKYASANANKERDDLLIEIMGMAGVGWSEGFSDEDLLSTRKWLRSKANSIEGGTSEVQLNVLAKHVLGLPVS